MATANTAIWDDMLPVAIYAYNTTYHRVLRECPYYLLHLRDPQIPYQMLETVPGPWYNVDDYKAERAIVARKMYERVSAYIEEGVRK